MCSTGHATHHARQLWAEFYLCDRLLCGAPSDLVYLLNSPLPVGQCYLMVQPSYIHIVANRTRYLHFKKFQCGHIIVNAFLATCTVSDLVTILLACLEELHITD